MITAIAVKENETCRIIDKLWKDSTDTTTYLWTCTIVKTHYGSDLRRCLNDIMGIMLQPGPSISILAFSHLWLSQNNIENHQATRGLSERNAADESDSDDDSEVVRSGGFDSDASGLLYALCQWCVSHNISNNRLYMVFESGIPRALRRIPQLIIQESFFVSHQPIENAQSLSRLPPPMTDKLVVVGVIGTRVKTSTLRSLANPKSVWMYCHEIVNCELGESPRVVRSLFETASSRQTPSMVLMDDADLILSTSGRIMREIVEEICACTSSEFTRGYFIYSALSREGVPEVLLANTNQFIDLE